VQKDGPASLPEPIRLSVGTARFPRDARLTGSTQFQRVFKNARLRSTDAVLAVLAVENELDIARLGLVVSRKAARRAVARNRVKRLIRNSFRNKRQHLSGLDIVVIGRPGIENKSNAELRHALERHWKRLGP